MAKKAVLNTELVEESTYVEPTPVEEMPVEGEVVEGYVPKYLGKVVAVSGHRVAVVAERLEGDYIVVADEAGCSFKQKEFKVL